MAFYHPYALAFIDDPDWYLVGFDFYMDAIFLLEILATFFIPIYDKNQRLITDRRVIALYYLNTYFMFDLLACFPLSYVKMTSAAWPRSKNDVKNFLTFNYNSVPRFYKLMLSVKFFRLKRAVSMLKFVLKKSPVHKAAGIIVSFCLLLFLTSRMM